MNDRYLKALLYTIIIFIILAIIFGSLHIFVDGRTAGAVCFLALIIFAIVFRIINDLLDDE